MNPERVGVSFYVVFSRVQNKTEALVNKCLHTRIISSLSCKLRLTYNIIAHPSAAAFISTSFKIV